MQRFSKLRKIAEICKKIIKKFPIFKNLHSQKKHKFLEIAEIFQKFQNRRFSNFARICKKKFNFREHKLHKFSKIADIALFTRGHGSERNFSLVFIKIKFIGSVAIS